MTIERPMFPPRDSSRVVQFADFAAARTAKKEPPESAAASFRDTRRAINEARLLEATISPENLTETCKNSRLRLSRRDAWRDADNLTDYWKARMSWHSALSIAQDRNIADANSYPKISGYGEGWSALVELWRGALVLQMLTPAPDLGAINWKRAQLRNGEHRFTKAKPEQLQRAIDADVEWLNNHPSKRSVPMSSERKEERRKFKEAMRQRIREIAASRGLSDDDIRPALSLRHPQIAEFTETHGVNLEWLYEGKGHPFAADPMRGPREADQQELRGMVCQMLQERDQ